MPVRRLVGVNGERRQDRQWRAARQRQKAPDAVCALAEREVPELRSAVSAPMTDGRGDRATRRGGHRPRLKTDRRCDSLPSETEVRNQVGGYTDTEPDGDVGGVAFQ